MQEKNISEEIDNIENILDENGAFQEDWEDFCDTGAEEGLTLKEICLGFYLKGIIRAAEISLQLEASHGPRQ